MAWQMVGSYYGPCSCKVSCPCELGELEADRGWCSGALVFTIDRGNIDGLDIGGISVALNGEWPSGMLSGNGTARLYFDPTTSADKRAALEQVIGGKRGGVFEPIGTLITNVLPSKEARISVQKGADETRITVGDFAELVVKPLRGATGELTRLLHGAAAFRDDIILAKGSGSHWRDPEMREWESGGHAEQADIDWSG